MGPSASVACHIPLRHNPPQNIYEMQAVLKIQMTYGFPCSMICHFLHNSGQSKSRAILQNVLRVVVMYFTLNLHSVCKKDQTCMATIVL